MTEDPIYKEIYEFLDRFSSEEEIHYKLVVNIGVDPVDETTFIKASIVDTPLTIFIMATPDFDPIVSSILYLDEEGKIVKGIPLEHQDLISTVIESIKEEWQT